MPIFSARVLLRLPDQTDVRSEDVKKAKQGDTPQPSIDGVDKAAV